MSSRKSRLICGLLAIALLPLSLWSLTLGHTDIALSELFGHEQDAAILRDIFFELRLPRTALALLVGAALGLSGAALQGFLRNPLADAGILGVSAGGALGAVLMLYFGWFAVWAPLLPLGGLLGGGLAVLLVYMLSRRSSVTLLILAGIAVNAFASATTALLLNLAPDPYAVLEIVFWMLGSLADRSLQDLYLALPLISLGGLCLLSSGRALDALSLGEDVAVSLGVNLNRTRLLILGGTAASVGAAVAVSGVIGFVGLVVPHLLRPMVGAQPSRLLLPSALAGALLLLVADMATRLIPAQAELKLGVLTAFLGAPFFLLLLFKVKRDWL